MTVLQSFPPELCSLICQDPILERLDLNSICFISHTFRNEAQRELSRCFPCLQGASPVKAWCLSLKRRPHLAIKIRGLALLLPRPSAFREIDVVRLTRTLPMCVNLKELSVLFQLCHRRRPGLQEYKYSSSTHMLSFVGHRFKLTKFVNGYFSQNNWLFSKFLESQPDLESLELHSDTLEIYDLSHLRHLKSLGCPPQVLDRTAYDVTRLRLDFKNSTTSWDRCEIDELGVVLNKNITRNMKSLAIFLKQKGSDFSEVIRVIVLSHICIQHLEIHQFFPTEIKEDLPLPSPPHCYYAQNIGLETLVFRPPPGLPEEAGDNPNLCAYVELRTRIGRRRVAEKLMKQTLPALKRLVFIVDENDYEYRRNSNTGAITGGNLITRNAREWALVK